ncbi:MAG: hypothetical protein LBD07_01855 [Spirochaetaceae bacterium]|nr:hypothetical protein [Spirochaetaceae bacterium]
MGSGQWTVDSCQLPVISCQGRMAGSLGRMAASHGGAGRRRGARVKSGVRAASACVKYGHAKARVITSHGRPLTARRFLHARCVGGLRLAARRGKITGRFCKIIGRSSHEMRIS